MTEKKLKQIIKKAQEMALNDWHDFVKMARRYYKKHAEAAAPSKTFWKKLLEILKAYGIPVGGGAAAGLGAAGLASLLGKRKKAAISEKTRKILDVLKSLGLGAGAGAAGIGAYSLVKKKKKKKKEKE